MGTFPAARRLLLAVLAATVTASAGAHAQAQAQLQVPPEVEAVAQKAFAELRSPVTPSHTLDFCPAEQAVALRDSIRMSALGGMPAEQIVEAVIARHGEQVRLVPRRSGFGWAAWLLTPLALVVGGALIAMRLRAMRHAGPAPVLAGGAMTDDERTRLDAALREFDRPEDEA
jgi:cytochrome c-type biogenesis protein CcmH/NrfF